MYYKCIHFYLFINLAFSVTKQNYNLLSSIYLFVAKENCKNNLSSIFCY